MIQFECIAHIFQYLGAFEKNLTSSAIAATNIHFLNTSDLVWDIFLSVMIEMEFSKFTVWKRQSEMSKLRKKPTLSPFNHGSRQLPQMKGT